MWRLFGTFCSPICWHSMSPTLNQERLLWHGTSWECVPNIVCLCLQWDSNNDDAFSFRFALLVQADLKKVLSYPLVSMGLVYLQYVHLPRKNKCSYMLHIPYIGLRKTKEFMDSLLNTTTHSCSTTSWWIQDVVSLFRILMDVSKNRGTPKWMVYNGKPY